MSEGLAQCLGVALEFFKEVLVIARLKVNDRNVLDQLLNVFLVLLEALAVPDHVWLSGNECLEVWLAVGTEVSCDGILVVDIAHGGRNQLQRRGGNLDIPVSKNFESAVVRNGWGGNRGSNLLLTEVVLESDLRGLGGGRCGGVRRTGGGLFCRRASGQSHRQSCDGRDERTTNLGGHDVLFERFSNTRLT